VWKGIFPDLTRRHRLTIAGHEGARNPCLPATSASGKLDAAAAFWAAGISWKEAGEAAAVVLFSRSPIEIPCPSTAAASPHPWDLLQRALSCTIRWAAETTRKAEWR
jgi:hypothetical protein